MDGCDRQCSVRTVTRGKIQSILTWTAWNERWRMSGTKVGRVYRLWSIMPMTIWMTNPDWCQRILRLNKQYVWCFKRIWGHFLIFRNNLNNKLYKLNIYLVPVDLVEIVQNYRVKAKFQPVLAVPYVETCVTVKKKNRTCNDYGWAGCSTKNKS